MIRGRGPKIRLETPWLLASKLLGPRGSSRLHVGDVGILHSHPGKGYRIESSWLHVGSLVGQYLRPIDRDVRQDCIST